MSAEQTVKSCSPSPEDQIGVNCNKTLRLLQHSYLRGEHKAFKEHMESNLVKQTFDESLEYGINLVTTTARTLSEVAPTLIILLQNGAKWDRDYLRLPDTMMIDIVTPYHVICRSDGDHQELLELMIKELGKSLLDAKDDKECTALMCAVQNANVKCVECLIANGADVDSMSSTHSLQARPSVTNMITDAVSPLVDSINLLHPNSPHPPNIMMDIFDILLNSGADVNKPCLYSNHTPIRFAAIVGNVTCVEKLIQKGAEIDWTGMNGNMFCMLAAYAGNVKMLKYLIEDNDIDKNSTDEEGLSVLYWAVWSGNIEAVRYLLDLGVTMTSYIPQERVTACKDCATSLLRHDIYEYKQTSEPYMLAISFNKPKVLRLMDEYGCELYKAAEILNYAICIDSVDVVDYLLCNYTYPMNYGYIENVIDIEWTSCHQTMLIDACKHASVKMIKLLLQHGADPNKNVCMKKHPSAINVAIYRQHVEVIAFFIRGGAYVNTRSYHRDMGVLLPFEAAVSKNNIYAAEMLLVSGCSGGVHSWDNNNDNHKLKVNLERNTRKLLKEWNVHSNNVLPLKQRCRMVILNHLCPQADKKITELPLPQQLIKYLSIPELDDIIKTFKENNFFR